MLSEEDEEKEEEELEEEERKTPAKHKRDVFQDISSILSSVFSDSACGEPTSPQHLVIDFTPKEGLDTDEDRDKCFEFWKLVDKEPLLQAFIVEPGPEDYMSCEMSPEEEKEVYLEPELEKTAMCVLNQATDQQKTCGAFESKMPRSTCSLGSREYIDNETMKLGKQKFNAPLIECACKMCCLCNQRHRNPPEYSRPALRKLCLQLHHWNSDHPKSYDPPGHPPDPGPSLHNLGTQLLKTTENNN